MEHQIWLTEKPEFNNECLFIAACKIRDEWDYNLYQIKKVFFDEQWYWGWFTGDGDEYGDIEDLKADKYLILKTLK